MLDVAGAKQTAARDGLAHQPNHTAIHDHFIADGQVAHGKLLFRGNLGERHIGLAREDNGFPGG